MEQLAAAWGGVSGGGGPSPRRQRRVSRPFPAPPVPPSPKRLAGDAGSDAGAKASPRPPSVSIPLRPRSATGHRHRPRESTAEELEAMPRPASAAGVRPVALPFLRPRTPATLSEAAHSHAAPDIEVLRKTPLPSLMRRLTRRRSEAGLPRVPVGYEYVVEAAVPPPTVSPVKPHVSATPSPLPSPVPTPTEVAPPCVLEPAVAPITPTQATIGGDRGPSPAVTPNSQLCARAASPAPHRATTPGPTAFPEGDAAPLARTASTPSPPLVPFAAQRLRPRPSLPNIITDVRPGPRGASLPHARNAVVTIPSAINTPLTEAQREVATYRERMSSSASREAGVDAKTPKTPRTPGFFRSLSHRHSVRVFSGRSGKSKTKKSKTAAASPSSPKAASTAASAASNHAVHHAVLQNPPQPQSIGRTLLRKASRTSLRHQLSSKSLRRLAETDENLAPPVPPIPTSLRRRGGTPEPRADILLQPAGPHHRQSKYDLPLIPSTLGTGDDPFAVAPARPPTVVEPSHTYHSVLSPEHSPIVSNIRMSTAQPSPAKSFNASWKMATASPKVGQGVETNEHVPENNTHEQTLVNAPTTPTIKVSRRDSPETAPQAGIPFSTGTEVRSAAKDDSTLLPPQTQSAPAPSNHALEEPETPTKIPLPEDVATPVAAPTALCPPSPASPTDPPSAAVTPMRNDASRASSVNDSPLDRFTPDDDFSPHDGSFLPARMEAFDGHSLSTIYEVASSASMRSVASFFLYSGGPRHPRSAAGTPAKNRVQSDLVRRMSLVSNGSPMRAPPDDLTDTSGERVGVQARLLELYEENQRLKQQLASEAAAVVPVEAAPEASSTDATPSATTTAATTRRPPSCDANREQTGVLLTAGLNWRQHAKEVDAMFQSVKRMALDAMAEPSADHEYNEGVHTEIAEAVNSLEVGERVTRDVHDALYTQLLKVARDLCQDLENDGRLLAAMMCGFVDGVKGEDESYLDTPEAVTTEGLARALVKLATVEQVKQTTYYETAQLYLQGVVLQSEVTELRDQCDEVLEDNAYLSAELEKVQSQSEGLHKSWARLQRESQDRENELLLEIERLVNRVNDLENECKNQHATSPRDESATRSLIRQSLRDLSSLLPNDDASAELGDTSLPDLLASASFSDMLLQELSKLTADTTKAEELGRLREEYNEQTDELWRVRRQTEATITRLQGEKEEVYRELTALKRDYKLVLQDKESASVIATSLKSRNESLHAEIEQLTLANVELANDRQAARIKDLEKRSSDDTLELVALQKREEALRADCDELRTHLSSVQMELELATRKPKSATPKAPRRTPSRSTATSAPFTPSRTVSRAGASPTKKPPARNPLGAIAGLPRRGAHSAGKGLSLRASSDGLRRAASSVPSGPASAGPTTTRTPLTTAAPRRRPVSALPMLRVTSATSAEGSPPHTPRVTPPDTPPESPRDDVKPDLEHA